MVVTLPFTPAHLQLPLDNLIFLLGNLPSHSAIPCALSPRLGEVPLLQESLVLRAPIYDHVQHTLLQLTLVPLTD